MKTGMDMGVAGESERNSSSEGAGGERGAGGRKKERLMCIEAAQIFFGGGWSRHYGSSRLPIVASVVRREMPKRSSKTNPTAGKPSSTKSQKNQVKFTTDSLKSKEQLLRPAGRNELDNGWNARDSYSDSSVGREKHAGRRKDGKRRTHLAALANS